MAWMSIDYVKCFDFIPQAVVLTLVLEVGMEPGTCRALGTMQKQLCRAFKIAGAGVRHMADADAHGGLLRHTAGAHVRESVCGFMGKATLGFSDPRGGGGG